MTSSWRSSTWSASAGDEKKFPGEISGGMRKRAGLARSLVLDPQIILCDEPDSGLDPVRTAYLSQLLIDINAQIDCTILIVTHNINIARTVPDNMGMLFRKHLVMFGPREVLLTSDEPVVKQFLNGRRHRPDRHVRGEGRGDHGRRAGHWLDAGHHDGGVEEIEGVPPQIIATPGMPERKAVGRRQARVREMLHTLPKQRPGSDPRRSRGHPQVSNARVRQLGRAETHGVVRARRPPGRSVAHSASIASRVAARRAACPAISRQLGATCRPSLLTTGR